MGFGEQLKKVRMAKDLTQAMVAQRAGIAKSTYASYENETREPSFKVLSHIMEILEVDANYLFQNTHNEYTKTTTQPIENTFNPKKILAENLIYYRKKSNISQKDFARLLGVIPSRISNWETGINSPSIDMLPAICSILHISVDDLYGITSEEGFSLSHEEREVIEKYRALDNRGKNIVESLLETAYITRPQ